MKFYSKLRQTALVLAVLTAAGCQPDRQAGMSSPGSVDSSPAGRSAGTVPLFMLKDPQGGVVSLEEALKKNKAVLLNFWATWCPPCREEIPDLIKLQSDYGAKGFTVIGVDVGESPSKVSAFINKMGINYPIALDRDQEVVAQYGIVGIPTSYLVSSDGRIIGEYHAATPDLFADVRKAVQ